MADVLTKEQRSFNMSRIRGSNTKPEVLLRKALFSRGVRGARLRYRLPGKPDIVFPAKKVAVFVDGCFWHRCPHCFQKPATNRKFWRDKINSNVRRDKMVTKELRRSGWKVVRVWEHGTRKHLNRCADRVCKYLAGVR
ncbi:MAG: very short patch repair endonuclease [Syntrophaceae bacterium]|nr:very short patch repair endonuclease [Syntrophaceae bacterium]